MTASLPRHRVLVFTTPTCPRSSRAKAYPRERGVPIREIDASREGADLLAILRESPAAVAAA